MSHGDGRTLFVIGPRGERGPVDRTEIRELLRGREIASTDQVRTAFGRPLGTVAEILAPPRRSTSDRSVVAPSPASPWTGSQRTVLIAAAAVVLAALAIAGTTLVQPSLPSAPAALPSTPAMPSQRPSAQDAAPPSAPPAGGWETAMRPLLGPGSVAGAETDLTYDGILGQSQPADAAPCRELGYSGVAMVDNEMWASSGARLAVFTTAGSGPPRQTATVELPGTASPDASLWRDRQVVLVHLLDDRVAVVGIADRRLTRFVALPAGTRQIFVPTGDGNRGVGELIALAGRTVHAVRIDGGGSRRIVQLPEVADATFHAIGLDPATGDLVAATTYPGAEYRCPTAAGRPTEQPVVRGPTIEQYLPLQGRLWTLRSFGTISSVADGSGTPMPWAYYANAAAPADDGTWWIASSQGLLRTPRDRGRPGLRLGGLPDVCGCAVDTDGDVLALAESGQRIVRLAAAAPAAGPLTSVGNEPWRIGAGWTDHASAIVPCADGALVADATAGQVWRFRPPHGDAPPGWEALCPAGTLHMPQSLAIDGGTLWIVQDGAVFSSTWEHPPMLPRRSAIAVPTGFTARAAAVMAPGAVVLASDHGVARYDVAGGAIRPAWARELGHAVTGLAAGGGFVFLADQETGDILALDPVTGSSHVAAGSADVPGGRMRPVALAVAMPWLIAVDREGARLLRFRIGRR